LIPVLSSGQSQDSISTATVRDAQAVTLLTQALDAAGGVAAIGRIRDYIGTGDITYYWARKAFHGSVTLKSLGFHQFRVDANLADGVHSNVINGRNSFHKTPDGITSALPSKNAFKIASGMFPAFQLLAAVQDKSVGASYGQQAYEISVQKGFPADRDLLAVRSKATKAHIYIDPNDLMIREIRDTVYAKDESTGEGSHEMRFSDYHVIDGVMVPFSITEFIAGQHTMTIQLKQVVFNTGLTQSDFE
jgi:hypothetical protein